MTRDEEAERTRDGEAVTPRDEEAARQGRNAESVRPTDEEALRRRTKRSESRMKRL